MRCLLLLLPVIFDGLAAAVQTPPSIRQDARSEVRVRLGKKNLLLECPVLSQTEVYIEWMRGDQLIGAGWTRYKITNDQKLRIKHVALEDRGSYVCRAVNGFGQVQFTYQVLILDEMAQSDERPMLQHDREPYWTDPASMQRSGINGPIHRLVGDKVELRCDTGGYPLPDIVWTKDGKKIVKTDWSGDYTFELEDLEESHSGRYDCKVTNIFGSKNATFYLIVTSTLDFQSNPIQSPTTSEHSHRSAFFVTSPRNFTVGEGSSASFTCAVRSVTQPNVRWLYRLQGGGSPAGGTVVNLHGATYLILEGLPNRTSSPRLHEWQSTLQLPHVQSQHAGQYVCAFTTLGNPGSPVLFKVAYLSITHYLDTPILIAIATTIIVFALLLAALCCVRSAMQRRAQQAKSASPRPPSVPALPTYPPPYPQPYVHSSIHSHTSSSPSHLRRSLLQYDPNQAAPLYPSFASHMDAVSSALTATDVYEVTTPLPSDERMPLNGEAQRQLRNSLNSSLSSLDRRRPMHHQGGHSRSPRSGQRLVSSRHVHAFA